MEFKETELPGVGKKFSVITSKGDKISVVVHLSGKKELFYFEADDYDEPVCDIEMNDEEAKQLGSILMGTYFQPVQEDVKQLLLKNLIIEWVKVNENSPLKNKSIKEAEVRKKTGATIISIIRGDNTITNPLPDEVIRENDVLIVLGNKEQIKKFMKEFHLSSQ
jgi:TrkA domain protein